MCVLKAFSNSRSFKGFAETTAMPVYSCLDKGEVLNPKTRSLTEENRISFDVSEKEWNDFPGQVADAIAFLTKWETDLNKLIADFEPEDVTLDFPLYSRLNDRIINQNDYLPKELIILAGRLGLCIGMSIYQEDRIADL